MFKKILVPVNGSKLAEQALEPAARLLEPVTGQLILMCLSSQQRISVSDESSADENDNPLSPAEAQAYLKIVEQQSQQLNCTIQTKVVDKADASAIIEAAEAEAVDLIVMAEHGSTGLKGRLLGNATQMVIHQAPCPVLVIRSTAPWAKLAVALNGEPWAEATLPWITRLAHSETTSLTLLHILEDVLDLSSMELGQLEGLSDIVPDPVVALRRRAEGLEYLQTVTAKHQAQLPLAAQMEVRSGLAVPSLLKFVEDEQVDLVALSTHNRSGWQRWIHRSTVDELLRGTECAVLVVPIVDEATP